MYTYYKVTLDRKHNFRGSRLFIIELSEKSAIFYLNRHKVLAKTVKNFDLSTLGIRWCAMRCFNILTLYNVNCLDSKLPGKLTKTPWIMVSKRRIVIISKILFYLIFYLTKLSTKLSQKSFSKILKIFLDTEKELCKMSALCD